MSVYVWAPGKTGHRRTAAHPDQPEQTWEFPPGEPVELSDEDWALIQPLSGACLEIVPEHVLRPPSAIALPPPVALEVADERLTAATARIAELEAAAISGSQQLAELQAKLAEAEADLAAFVQANDELKAENEKLAAAVQSVATQPADSPAEVKKD